MYSDSEEIKIKHKGDIPTLWAIYQSDEKFYSNFYFKLSVALTVVLLVLQIFSTTSTYEIIQKVIEVAFGILPSMLGFILGAYVLVVGFGSQKILKQITKPLKGQKNYSFYQKLNSVMGVSVLLQVTTLISSFLLRIWDKIQDGMIITSKNTCITLIEHTVTFFGLFLILLLLIYSILILASVAKHVFMFSQTIHFFESLTNESGFDDNSPK